MRARTYRTVRHHNQLLEDIRSLRQHVSMPLPFPPPLQQLQTSLAPPTYTPLSITNSETQPQLTNSANGSLYPAVDPNISLGMPISRQSSFLPFLSLDGTGEDPEGMGEVDILPPQLSPLAFDLRSLPSFSSDLGRDSSQPNPPNSNSKQVISTPFYLSMRYISDENQHNIAY